MNLTKRLLALASVLVIGCAVVFAFDPSEDLVGPEKIESCTRQSFEEELYEYGQSDYEEIISDAFGDDIQIVEMCVLAEDCVGVDGEEVLSAIRNEIKKASPKKNDVFLSLGIDDSGDCDTVDCYLVFSHYQSAKDILNWIVFFSVGSDE